MNILVTGGAGYIGSVAVRLLLDAGHSVAVVDSLVKGKKELVDSRAIFFKCDITDVKALDVVFSSSDFDAVMHFAAHKDAGESMRDASKYSQNVIGTMNVLDLMVKHKVGKIIFSSSAAVYGNPEYVPVDENHPTEPINYYGFTKLKCEQLMDWYSKIHGIVCISLRYFNVAGDMLGYVDPKASNVIPIIMEVAVGKRKSLDVYGDDYDTADGTGVRDYIDVNDLAEAHMLALELDSTDTINLGTSKGTSVMELLSATESICGHPVAYSVVDRRAGDTASLTASFDKAAKILGWKPKRSIDEMIGSMHKAYLGDK